MSGAVALLPPCAFMAWTESFFLTFHLRATCRAHQVVMSLLCSVKLPSFKFLPAATSRVHTLSRHTTLLSSPLSLLARPTELHLLVLITMENDTFKFHTWQVYLSCILLSRIPTLLVHMHAMKECRGSGGRAPHILKIGTRWMRVMSLTLRETPSATW